MRITFNKPYATGRELGYIAEAIKAGHLSGDGDFTQKCNEWLERTLGVPHALLTHSCTAALEMAALLVGLQPGDEVIMPSFTFVSTANAVVLRGAIPVFVDVRADTFNLDETLIEAAITSRTKAIFVVHYAGVGCDMDAITAIAVRNDLIVVEDAAQAILSRYKGAYLGTFGQIAAFSFHETKNLISGEGGALVLNNGGLREQAEIIREKGTNRTKFFRGEVDKYTWVDVGSSYLPSEILAAFLFAQFEEAQSLVDKRKAIWNRYHEAFAVLENLGEIRRPIIPEDCEHNGHIYYLVLPNATQRTDLIEHFKAAGIYAPIHYVPLHSAPAGIRFGRPHGSLPITDQAGSCLVRLPLWIGIENRLDEVIDCAVSFFRHRKTKPG